MAFDRHSSVLRPLASRLCLLAVAALLTGCPQSAVQEGLADLAAGCAKDADCPGGFFCVNHACRIDSAPCDTTADCTSGDICGDDGCVPPCTDSSCPDGTSCDPGTKLCVAPPPPDDAGTPPAPDPECKADADCTGGYACVAGACTCTVDDWETFAQPLFASSCQKCHAWAGSYVSVFGIQRAIALSIADGSQPPGGFADQRKPRLLRWLACGAPR